MKTFEFKQNDLKRGIPFAIVYLVLVFVGCYFYFGGLLGMADAANILGSDKATGFLIGLAVLAPFLILLTVLMPKVKVELGLDKITISDKNNQKVIFYNEIYALQLNVSNLNKLDFLGEQNNVLAHMQPQSKPEILTQIINEISNHVMFTKLKGRKKYFGNSIETTIYTKKF